MTEAIRYIRFSDPKQEKGSSRERQADLIDTHCKANGWTVIDTVEDLGKSAWKGDHLRVGNLGAFSNRVRSGEVAAGTVLVVEKIDRLSREGYDILTDWMREMTRLGLVIATVDGDKTYDKDNVSRDMESMMLRLLKAEAARDYVDAMAGRVRKGIKKRQAKIAETRQPVSKIRPKWLDQDNKPIPERVAAIHQIYELYAEGHGPGTVAKLMNDSLHQPWTTKKWLPTTIRHVLANHNVDGDFQPVKMVDGKRVPVGDPIPIYPRILPADLIARVRARLATKSDKGGRPSPTLHVNIFKGLTRCGYCMGRVHMMKSETPSGVRRYFRCYDAAHKAGCDHALMHRAEPLEAAALDQMLHLALDDRFFSQPSETTALANRIAELEKKKRDLENQRRRLLKLILAKDDPDAGMVEMRNELTRHIDDIGPVLDKAKDDLVKAKGAVDPAEHLARVMEVRASLDHPDQKIAQAARTRIATALQSVVQFVTFDDDDTNHGDSQRTASVVLVGGVRAWKFNTMTGALIAEIDLTAEMLADETGALERGLIGSSPIQKARMDAYLARNK